MQTKPISRDALSTLLADLKAGKIEKPVALARIVKWRDAGSLSEYRYNNARNTIWNIERPQLEPIGKAVSRRTTEAFAVLGGIADGTVKLFDGLATLDTLHHSDGLTQEEWIKARATAKHIADAKTPATDKPELPRRNLQSTPRPTWQTNSIISMMEDDAHAAVLRAGLIEELASVVR